MKLTSELQDGDTLVIGDSTYTLVEKTKTWGRTASYGTRIRTEYNLVLKSNKTGQTRTLQRVSPNKRFEVAL